MHVVTGRDGRGGVAETALTLTPDDEGPTGGALAVNGVAAGAVPTVSHAAAAYPIDVRTDYAADSGSGLASSVLTVRSAPLGDTVCGSFGAPAEVAGTPTQVGTSPTCYLYVLTGTDAVGNTTSISTVVKYDADPPTQAVTLVGGTNAALSGTTIYFRAADGSFTLSNEVTDGESGPASAEFSAVSTTGWTHGAETVTTGTGTTPTLTYASGTYSFTAGASTPPAHLVRGRDVAGNVVTTSLAITRDSTPPTTGALTVNGTAASGAGTVSTANSDSFTIGTRTANTDAASGLASSTLTREFAALTGSTCAAFSGSVTITGTPAQTGLAKGCYRYTLTGVDNAGNTSQISTTVHIDVADSIRVTPSVVPLGSETLVNTTTDGSQDSNNVVMQAVASDADGNYVVVWHGPGIGRDVYAQRFSADGTALGAEFTVNTFKASDQAMANVAMDAAGNFVIAWQSQGQDDIDTEHWHLRSALQRRRGGAGRRNSGSIQRRPACRISLPLQ